MPNPPLDPAAWLAARPTIHCRRMRVRMPEEDCIERQLESPSLTVFAGVSRRQPRDPWCQHGRCWQGAELLIARGLLRRVTCPACGGGDAAAGCASCEGRGWVPEETGY